MRGAARVLRSGSGLTANRINLPNASELYPAFNWVSRSPIMMTMIVATLGLLPAAMSHDIGSDSQRPFAIVIVGGLIVELFVSVILWPTLYVFWARPGDRLPASEQSFMDEGEHVD